MKRPIGKAQLRQCPAAQLARRREAPGAAGRHGGDADAGSQGPTGQFQIVALQFAVRKGQPAFAAPGAGQRLQVFGQAGKAGGGGDQRHRQAGIAQIGNPRHRQAGQRQPAGQGKALRGQSRIDQRRQQRPGQPGAEQAAINTPAFRQRAAIRKGQAGIGLGPAFLCAVDAAGEAPRHLPACKREGDAGEIAIGRGFGGQRQPAGQRFTGHDGQQCRRIDAAGGREAARLAGQRQIGQWRRAQPGCQRAAPITPAPGAGGCGAERLRQADQRCDQPAGRCIQLGIKSKTVTVRFGIEVQDQRIAGCQRAGGEIEQRAPGLQMDAAAGRHQPLRPGDAFGDHQPAQLRLGNADFDIGQDARIGHRLQARQAFQRGNGDDQFSRFEPVADQRGRRPIQHHLRRAGKTAILVAQFDAFQHGASPQIAADPCHMQ